MAVVCIRPKKIVMKISDRPSLLYLQCLLSAKYVSSRLDVVHYLDVKQREFFSELLKSRNHNHVIQIAPLHNSSAAIFRKPVPGFFQDAVNIPLSWKLPVALIILAAVETLAHSWPCFIWHCDFNA
jgi:hypothetical protein